MTNRLIWGGWVLDDAFVEGKPRVRLSPKEVLVMKLLMTAKGRVVGKRELGDALGSASWSSIRTTVKTLRSALGRSAIGNRRGYGVEGGYRLERRDKAKRERDGMRELIRELEGVLARARRILRARKEEGTEE